MNIFKIILSRFLHLSSKIFYKKRKLHAETNESQNSQRFVKKIIFYVFFSCFANISRIKPFSNNSNALIVLNEESQELCDKGVFATYSIYIFITRLRQSEGQ